MDNWLAKLASEQPTNEDALAQALEDMPIEELRSMMGEEAPTPNLDSFPEKVAQADQMGRELAREQGPGLAAQAESRAMQNHAVMQAIQDMPDDEAVKLAFIIDNGSEDQVKEAFAGLVAKGLGAAKKLVGSGAGKKALNWAGKNPNKAMAVGGAAAGGVANKATGGSFTRGALGGAAAGYGAGRLAGSGQVGRRIRQVGDWAKTASLQSAAAAMTRADLEKIAYLEPDQKNEWILQFEGTPLLQQALELAQQELQAEMEDIEERSERDQMYGRRDTFRAQKKLLELQLVAQRNGLSEPDGDELGGEATTADHPEPDEDDSADEGTPMNPQEVAEAQEQIKEAYARAFAERIAKTASWKRKALLGAGAAGAAAASGVAGNKMGKKKGRREGAQVGFQVGARRGFNAGVRRGYAAGIMHAGKGSKEKKAAFLPR